MRKSVYVCAVCVRLRDRQTDRQISLTWRIYDVFPLQVLLMEKVLGENTVFSVVDTAHYTAADGKHEVVECLLVSVESAKEETQQSHPLTVITWLTITTGEQSRDTINGGSVKQRRGQKHELMYKNVKHEYWDVFILNIQLVLVCPLNVKNEYWDIFTLNIFVHQLLLVCSLNVKHEYWDVFIRNIFVHQLLLVCPLHCFLLLLLSLFLHPKKTILLNALVYYCFLVLYWWVHFPWICSTLSTSPAVVHSFSGGSVVKWWQTLTGLRIKRLWGQILALTEWSQGVIQGFWQNLWTEYLYYFLPLLPERCH